MACCILPRRECSTIRRPQATFTLITTTAQQSLISHTKLPTANSHPTCSAVLPLLCPAALACPALHYTSTTARTTVQAAWRLYGKHLSFSLPDQVQGMSEEETEFHPSEQRAQEINFSEPPLANCTLGSISPSPAQHRTVRLVTLESCASGPPAMDGPG
ncbi:hypothetical protein ONS96_010748 [Cadophora gregata f. sp. sojae]|nr:hypothetical protein ONS96_010748 [Cadophora gregata f. sp. sojae]